MNRFLKTAAWTALFCLMALAPVWMASAPVGRGEYIRKNHSAWAGVLRIWKCEGWESGNGTMTAWLTGCIDRFERRNPGVYIQLTDVSRESLRTFAEGKVNPPDMILYAPGMLDAPYSLMELEQNISVRKPLDELGLWQGARYAVPVALGGYAMAVNSQLLPETPQDWRGYALQEEKTNRGSEKIGLLNAPKDGEYTAWSAAMLCLFAGQYGAGKKDGSAPVGEGMELGLPQAEEAETPEAVRQPEWIENGLPAGLPDDFMQAGSVYAQFTAGQIAAMPVTQREIRRLQQLSDEGKAPDWRAEAMGQPFTDQALLFSVAAWPRDDLKERQALAVRFMELMLSEEMQTRLTSSRAFSVLDRTELYRGNPGMRALEQALNSDYLLVPPAFGGEWRAFSANRMMNLPAGAETREEYELLRQAMEE